MPFPGFAPAGDPSAAVKQTVLHKWKLRAENDEHKRAVFVGGLRKSTSEDKVTSHFSKYGQVDNVDIKRLPDGTSRGFAFVKFVDPETVDRVVEARSSHMIDNKWVAVRPHGGSAFNAAQNAEKDAQAKAIAKEERKLPEPNDGTAEDFEEKWSEKYLTVAAQVGALQNEDEPPSDGVSTAQAMTMIGQAAANPMAAMGAMPNMGQAMMPMMMGGGMNGCMAGGMGMMGMMMNPMMMMMSSCMRPMGSGDDGEAVPGSPDEGPSSGPAPKERSRSDRSAPY